MYTNTINPATGQPQVTAQPTVTPSNVGQITTPTTFTGTTMAGVNPTQPTTSLPVAGTTQPGTLPTLPNFGDVTGGVTSFNFFRNEDGVILQIPVLNGRQIYDEPDGYQRFDPDNPSANPWTPDEPDEVEDEPEEEKPDEIEYLGGEGGEEDQGFQSGLDFADEIDPNSPLGGFLGFLDDLTTDDPEDVGLDTSAPPGGGGGTWGGPTSESEAGALGEDPDAPGVDAAADTAGSASGPPGGGDPSMSHSGPNTGPPGGGDPGMSGSDDSDDGGEFGDPAWSLGGLAARRKLKKPIKRSRSNGKGFARRM
jgi:hypothetical protein